VYFKLEVSLNLAISFQGQEPVTFATDERSGTLVTIRPLTIEEKQNLGGKFLICTAFTEEQPSTEVHAIFERLANNLPPKDNQEKEGWTRKQLMRSLNLLRGHPKAAI